ncbi:hypothetical protein [Spiroplasma endosymbiont of Diplazon laetatorius]|uniref:hypothetical protein n=1 Tax=Spiroplasma endosymbiont of Diplazon laetatorius TaxID=3066322 RepID=UPI0030CFD2EB
MYDFSLVDLISLISGIVSLILATFISIWIYRKEDYKDFYKEFKEKYFFTFNKVLIKDINSFIAMEKINNESIDLIENHLNKVLYFISFLSENKQNINKVFKRYKTNIKMHLKNLQSDSIIFKGKKINKIPEIEKEFYANFLNKNMNNVFLEFNNIYNNLLTSFFSKKNSDKNLDKIEDIFTFLSKNEPDIILTIVKLYNLSKIMDY